MPKLAHSLNQPVIVASPVFFGDAAPRQLILVDIEGAGLWFGGEALNETLAKEALTTPPEGATAALFLPFEQIAYVIDPRQFTWPARALRAPVSAAALRQPPARRPGRRQPRRRKGDAEAT